MRVLLFLGLSVALLFAVVFADHHKSQGKKQEQKDDHEKKEDSHHHHHHGRHHHGHGHHHGHHHKHHHANETLACHKLAESNSNFAFDLYKQIAADRPSGNIVISPVSISIALAFLSLGAKAKTHDQIIKGIGFNTSEIPEKDIHNGFHHLLDVLNDDDSELHVDSGNGLFVSQTWKILDEFLDNAKKLYGSEVTNVDFSNTEDAKKLINSYVEKQTNGKIADVLSSVDKDTALVLVNFIYFRGQWENPFEEKYTKEGDFHVTKDKTVKVPFMSRTGFYDTAFLDDATVVAVPYKGNATALFILPKEGKLEEVEANLKGIVKKWKKSKQRDLADLSIPKFSIFGSFDLKEVLPKFGIADLFSDSADFSGITGAPDLKISKALHKAKINVDEKGTEAAGTTVLEAIPMMLPRKIDFNAPFLFTVYSKQTRNILFMDSPPHKTTMKQVRPVRCRSAITGIITMKVFLVACLSQALLCTVVFGDEVNEEEHHDDNVVDYPLQKIVPGNIKFSFSLYAYLAEKYPKDNLWFSPMSISLLFSMLSVGAKGQTRDQMYNALGFNMSAISEEDINRGFQNLLQVLNEPNTDLELSSANAIFVDQHAKLVEKFSEDLKNFYKSEAISMDFQDGEGAKTQINSYVEKKTNGKIKDLLQSLSPQTLLVLINTIYFKGTWVNAFNEAGTRERDFHVDENTIVKVPMMTMSEYFHVAILQEMGCVVVDVPYKGNTSAILILPDKGKLQEVERAVRNVSMQQWAELMRPMKIRLSIPKFCLSATLNLKNELPHLGMKDVFSGHADLSGITGDHVEVSEAIHKAVLSVDEKGAEAAGASAVVITKLSGPFQVIANRPFLLTLLHKPTDTILFTGRVMKPEKC
ncbi:uncharacterized protein ACMZJ9_019817 [Mantella aurantiaca]